MTYFFEFRDKLTKRNVKLGSLTSSMPDLVYQGGNLISGGILGKDSVLSIYPNVELILAYCTAYVVETKTLLPNKLVVSVSKRYAAYGDHDADVRLLNPKNYKNFTGFSHYKLDQEGDHQFDVPAGVRQADDPCDLYERCKEDRFGACLKSLQH